MGKASGSKGAIARIDRAVHKRLAWFRGVINRYESRKKKELKGSKKQVSVKPQKIEE